jgi:allantoicase
MLLHRTMGVGDGWETDAIREMGATTAAIVKLLPSNL